MLTYTQQLANVEAAIARAETAQEAESDSGRRIRRPDLEVLYRRHAYLVPLAAREAAGRTGPSISRGAA